MAKMIQVRNVPERTHRELVRRARARGQTLTRYLEEILERETSRPPAEDVFARIRARSRVDISGAEVIRQVRRERDREMSRRLGLGRRRPAG
jgi:antitoxin FitA